jgi:hypothetical protein
MRISTAREFRDTTGLLRSRTPILVTRRGRVAGIFFPRPELTLPIELKQELYNMLSSDVARQLKRRKVSEDDVLKDFEASRRSAVQLVADANVLLSAVIGGRAALVLRHEQVEQVFTPAPAYDEVFEYLAPLAKKKRLQLDTLLLTLAALPVTVVERSEYEHHLPEWVGTMSFSSEHV